MNIPVNILTCAQLKLDDSAEYQIVPNNFKSNIDNLEHRSVVFKLISDGFGFFNRIELQICKYKVIHKNLVNGFSRFQRFVEPTQWEVLDSKHCVLRISIDTRFSFLEAGEGAEERRKKFS
jgi:hypothetical protein